MWLKLENFLLWLVQEKFGWKPAGRSCQMDCRRQAVFRVEVITNFSIKAGERMGRGKHHEFFYTCEIPTHRDENKIKDKSIFKHNPFSQQIVTFEPIGNKRSA